MSFLCKWLSHVICLNLGFCVIFRDLDYFPDSPFLQERKRVEAGAARDSERDISEQIALGKAVPKSKDGLFDQRLFNQDDGTQAGFGDDDSMYENVIDIICAI